MNVELSEEQVQALYAFLQRVQMQGSEAEACVEIKQAIRRAVEKDQARVAQQEKVVQTTPQGVLKVVRP